MNFGKLLIFPVIFSSTIWAAQENTDNKKVSLDFDLYLAWPDEVEPLEMQRPPDWEERLLDTLSQMPKKKFESTINSLPEKDQKKVMTRLVTITGRETLRNIKTIMEQEAKEKAEKTEK